MHRLCLSVSNIEGLNFFFLNLKIDFFYVPEIERIALKEKAETNFPKNEKPIRSTVLSVCPFHFAKVLPYYSGAQGVLQWLKEEGQ